MKKKSEHDSHWMALALAEANKGLFTAHPNPRVGCVVIRDNQLLAQGFHAYTGGAHAEVAAVTSLSTLEGATCYVTLEPCSHHGLTPPCADLLISKNLARCVVASLDPNPKVAGEGVARLIQAGIDVDVGVLAEEAHQLNQGFFQRMLTGRPRVIAKVASSLDGKTAMLSGESQWITSEQARHDGHKLRASCGALLTSWKTVSQDKAKMTVRVEEITENPHFKQPLRAILDRRLKLSPKSTCFEQPGEIVLYVSETLPQSQRDTFKEQVAYPEQLSIQPLPEYEHHLDLNAVLCDLGQRGINDVLIEGGAQLLGAMLQHNLIDDLVLYMAPKLLGSQARGLFDIALEMLDQHKALLLQHVEQIGPDLKIVAQVKR